MIDRGHALRLIAQARQLGISRGSIYYLPRAVSDSDLAGCRVLHFKRTFPLQIWIFLAAETLVTAAALVAAALLSLRRPHDREAQLYPPLERATLKMSRA